MGLLFVWIAFIITLIVTMLLLFSIILKIIESVLNRKNIDLTGLVIQMTLSGAAAIGCFLVICQTIFR
jgi:heme exporter protein D